MTAKRGCGRGARELKIRVKTAKGRPTGSTRWLERQLNDPYVKRARSEGWRSRSAFKLMEIDDKYRILKPGFSVLDLGCAPGGWCQAAVLRVNSLGERQSVPAGRVIGIDLAPTEPIAGAELYEEDFLVDGADTRIKLILNGPVNVILSDMAAPMIGHRQTDHLRTMSLAEAVFEFAEDALAENGAVIAKVLSGGAHLSLQRHLKQAFRSVRHVKPPASRVESSERYVVAQGCRIQRGPNPGVPAAVKI